MRMDLKKSKDTQKEAQNTVKYKKCIAWQPLWLAKLGHQRGFSSQCKEILPEDANGSLWAKHGRCVYSISAFPGSFVYSSVGCLPTLKKWRDFKLFKSISRSSLKKSEDASALGLLSHLAAVSWSWRSRPLWSTHVRTTSPCGFSSVTCVVPWAFESVTLELVYRVPRIEANEFLRIIWVSRS